MFFAGNVFLSRELLFIGFADLIIQFINPFELFRKFPKAGIAKEHSYELLLLLLYDGPKVVYIGNMASSGMFLIRFHLVNIHKYP